jgi:hypothetical protein
LRTLLNTWVLIISFFCRLLKNTWVLNLNKEYLLSDDYLNVPKRTNCMDILFHSKVHAQICLSITWFCASDNSDRWDDATWPTFLTKKTKTGNGWICIDIAFALTKPVLCYAEPNFAECSHLW